MAINNPNVTVQSGYYNNAMPPSYHRTSAERRISQQLARPGMAGVRAVMRALNGAAPGAAVNLTRTRIAAATPFNPVGLGGVRQIETVADVHNGVTTAAQRDYINTQIIDSVVASQSYPTDLSGNGGGGKMQR